MNLFVEKEEKGIEKVGVLSLSYDDTKWTKAIISEFLSEYPMLQDTPINLTWKKKEGAKGYAVGNISVLNGSVPVIVKNYIVYPFDVIVFPSTVIPLDEYTITELTSSDSPFMGAAQAKGKDTLSLFGDREQQWTPNDSAYVANSNQSSYTRPAMKVASFLDKISEFDVKDVKNMLEVVENDENLLNFYENGEFLEKIAEKASSSQTKWINLVDHINIDRQYVYEDENGNYFVKQAYSGVDFTKTKQINFEEYESMDNLYATMEKKAELDEEVEFLAFDEIKVGQIGQFVDKYGNTTEKLEILGIEKIAKLKDYIVLPIKEVNRSLIIDRKGNYAIVNRKVSKPSANYEDLEEFTENKPEVGNKGVWVVDGVATEVFRINKIKPDLSSPGSFEIHASRDGMLIVYSLIKSYLPGIKRKEHKLNEYWVPGNAIFAKLDFTIVPEVSISELNTLVDDVGRGEGYRLRATRDLVPADFLIGSFDAISKDKIPENSFFGVEKKASTIIDSLPHIVYRDTAGFYNLFGPEFEKYASNGHQITNLDKNGVAWPLIHMGVSKDVVEKALNMGYGNEIKIANCIKAPINAEQFKEAVINELVKEATEIDEVPVFKDAVKIAAQYQDSTAVDSILSLGLVNKFNIMEYLQLIPDYERVLSELARLLIYSRLTDLGIAPELLAQTVSTFNEVLYKLKSLKEVLSYNKTALPSKV